jgi:hypothetical protein
MEKQIRKCTIAQNTLQSTAVQEYNVLRPRRQLYAQNQTIKRRSFGRAAVAEQSNKIYNAIPSMLHTGDANSRPRSNKCEDAETEF